MNFTIWLCTFLLGTTALAIGQAWIDRAEIARWLFTVLFNHVALVRRADFTIGSPLDPYMQRWWLIPRNRFCNVYLHCFLRSDDDRALHDHPWRSLSLLLRGECVEHTIDAGGIHQRRWLCVGDVRLRSATLAHRIELPRRVELSTAWKWHEGIEPCWTLFLTGPVERDWGFHCAERGWVPWQAFTDPATGGATTGKGCDA